jgi:hypothetical protein
MSVISKVSMSNPLASTNETLLVTIPTMLVERVRVVEVDSAKITKRMAGESRRRRRRLAVVAFFYMSSELRRSEEGVFMGEYLEISHTEVTGVKNETSALLCGVLGGEKGP